jgi:hypothetical protein
MDLYTDIRRRHGETSTTRTESKFWIKKLSKYELKKLERNRVFIGGATSSIYKNKEKMIDLKCKLEKFEDFDELSEKLN